MANQPEDIDRLFRDRFSDVKDHSVDPSSQWEMFENSLDAVMNDTSAARRPKFSGISVGIATSVAILVAASVYTYIGSSSVETINEEVPAMSSVVNTAVEDEKTGLSANTVENKSEALLGRTEEKNYTTGMSPAVGSAIPEEIVDALEKISNPAASGTHEIPGGPAEDISEEIQKDFVQEMALLDPFLIRNSVIAGNGAKPIRGTDRWSTRTFMYFKAGARTGMGNNVRFKEGMPINLYFGLGYGYRFNSRWAISAEAVLTRKSGQNLERMRRHHIHNVNQFQVPANGDVAPSNFMVDKSFIATRLDVFQAPLLVSYSPAFFNKLTFGAGAYVEYLIRAENDIYFVYNDTYVSSLGVGETNSLEGLRRFRYGALGNVTYHWMDKVNFSLRGMVLLKDGTKQELGLVPVEGNHLPLDVQLGVNYLLVH